MKPPASIPAPEPEPRTRGRNRPQEVAETIKTWITARGLVPGDRLPQEHQLITELDASKGTVREALKVLETQGLIRTRTGPGGGAFITEVEDDRTAALLANHFFFKPVTIADIYEMRIALEPVLARDIARTITPDQIAALHEKQSFYASAPASIEEERRQRAAELEFHETLASFSGNPLLGFACGFLARMLKDLAVCRRIYEQPNPELRESGLSYQDRLIAALESGDADAAHDVMREHMIHARAMMLAQEAQIARAFLTPQ